MGRAPARAPSRPCSTSSTPVATSSARRSTAFEQEAAAALGVAHGVGVANGTDALVLALRALGMEPGDEVICPRTPSTPRPRRSPPSAPTPVFADIDAALQPRSRGGRGRGHAAHTRRRRRAHLRPPGGHGGAARALRPARPRAGGGRRPGVRRPAATAWPRRRRRRDVLVLPDQEPRRRSATAAWSRRRARTSPTRVPRAALPRLEGQADVRRRSATTRASTSCRPRCCACSSRALDGWNARAAQAAGRYARAGARRARRRCRRADGARTSTTCTWRARPTRDACARRCQAAGVGCGVYYGTPLHLQPVFADLGSASGDLPVTEALRPRRARPADVPDAHRAAQQREVVAAVASARATGVRVWVDLTNAPHAVVLRAARPRAARRAATRST